MKSLFLKLSAYIDKHLTQEKSPVAEKAETLTSLLLRDYNPVQQNDILITVLETVLERRTNLAVSMEAELLQINTANARLDRMLSKP